jgi:PAS domain S-box-containing protein
MTVDAAALRLAALVESFDDAVIIGTLDGTIETWNRPAERLFGYTGAEAIGRSSRLLVPPERQQEDAAVMARVRRGERLGPFDTVRLRKGGVPVEVSLSVSPIRTDDGQVIGTSTIARDITERKRAESEALRLAAIVKSSDDAIVSKDLNGTITSWNRAAERMFGYTAEEVVGRSITVIIPTERLAEEDFVLGKVRTGVGIDHFETVRRRKDGTLIDISLTVSPIIDPSGRIVGVSKIARDISERKQLLRQVEEASRLKDEFLATLSHELRTPLNAIMGYVHMLREGTIPDEGRMRALELIDRNTRTLTRLVSDVLDVSTIIAGKARLKLERCDLASVLDAALDVVRPTMEAKRLTLERDVAAEPMHVLGDPDRLQQVFWNLLVNAMKFTPEAGRITVRLERDGSNVRAAVIDTGAGIAPDFLPHLFQRFRQGNARVDREFSGLGLGLALVRHFVELHGGAVEATSEGPGKGSTFVVSLPLLSSGPSP